MSRFCYLSNMPLRLASCLLTGLLLGFLLSGCWSEPDLSAIDFNDVASAKEIELASSKKVNAEPVYLFGFDLRNGPREDARQYLPLLEYLSNKTGYQFRLHFSESAETLLADLTSGKLDFAAIGAGTYLTANSDTSIVPLVRGVNSRGELGYRSILVVAPDSPLDELHDLRGRRIAFGSPTSTQGHWIPRIMFHEADIGLEEFEGYVYTGSHRACAEAVIGKRVDACGMQDTLARLLIESGVVRALATSEVFPSSGIFSTASVPSDIRERVAGALVEFDPQGRDREGLYHWERTEMAGGFAPAYEDDYAVLRSQAERLGLLQGIDW